MRHYIETKLSFNEVVQKMDHIGLFKQNKILHRVLYIGDNTGMPLYSIEWFEKDAEDYNGNEILEAMKNVGIRL